MADEKRKQVSEKEEDVATEEKLEEAAIRAAEAREEQQKEAERKRIEERKRIGKESTMGMGGELSAARASYAGAAEYSGRVKKAEEKEEKGAKKDVGLIYIGQESGMPQEDIYGGFLKEIGNLPDTIKAQQARLAQVVFETKLLDAIREQHLKRYEISTGNLYPEFSTEKAREEGQKFIKKAPVTTKALDEYVEKGPDRMEEPSIPDMDRRILAKSIMSTFASIMKGIGSAAFGGTTAETAGMVVDPGTAILAEEGRMLMAEVEKHEEKKERIREINFMLQKEFRENVLRMQS
ncbi:MAG: hypothetical protein N2234_08195, partial [Planctomycetota bacterium]|nr:hypothetical protein [Planctomycetota bacterium]